MSNAFGRTGLSFAAFFSVSSPFHLGPDRLRGIVCEGSSARDRLRGIVSSSGLLVLDQSE